MKPLLEKNSITTKGYFMKYVILIIMVWIMGGCATTDVKTQKFSPNGALPAINYTPSNLILAWANEPDGSKWTAYLDEAMKDLPESGQIITPCKKFTLKPCAKQLLSIIAKRESNFKPETSFNETGHLQGVVSRGLFQISKDSANQSAYGCSVVNAKDLYDPEINIKCAVKILAYQAKKTGSLMDGCAKYWSVCRSKNGTSKSYKEIMNYMEKF